MPSDSVGLSDRSSGHSRMRPITACQEYPQIQKIPAPKAIQPRHRTSFVYRRSCIHQLQCSCASHLNGANQADHPRTRRCAYLSITPDHIGTPAGLDHCCKVRLLKVAAWLSTGKHIHDRNLKVAATHDMGDTPQTGHRQR